MDCIWKKKCFFSFLGEGADTESGTQYQPVKVWDFATQQSPRFLRFVVFAFASGDNSYCEPYGILILKKVAEEEVPAFVC